MCRFQRNHFATESPCELLGRNRDRGTRRVNATAKEEAELLCMRTTLRGLLNLKAE